MNLAVIPVAASVSEWSDSFLERLPLLARDWMTSWLPEPWRWLVNSLLSIAVILSVFGLLFAYVTLAERKILGRIQNRPGPNRTPIPFTKLRFFGLAQPFADDATYEVSGPARRKCHHNAHRPVRKRPFLCK